MKLWVSIVKVSLKAGLLPLMQPIPELEFALWGWLGPALALVGRLTGTGAGPPLLERALAKPVG